MKKIILFIVMLLGFGLVTNAQTASTIEFNSAGGNMPAVNDNFDVPISVSGLDATSMPAGITAIIIDFTYDNTVLTHTGLTNTVAGLTYDFHEETLGTIHIEIYDWINLWYNVDGNIFDFQFDYDVEGFSSFVFESTTRYGDDGFIEIPFPTLVNGLIGEYVISGGAWNTATNWNSGAVPLADRDVYVATGTETTIDGAAVANNVTIQPGGELTLNSSNTLDLDGDFLIESDASGSGSFINNGTLTIDPLKSSAQCYVTDGQWHGIASPVEGETFNAMYLGGAPLVWIMEYDELLSDYSYITDLDQGIGDMKGWFTFVEDLATPETFTFTGDFRTAEVGLDDNMLHSVNGHNFVGNAFTSAIDWEASSGWEKTNLYDAIYVYDDDTWATYGGDIGVNGGSRYIAMSQGFFVQVASSGAGTLKMDNQVCVHNPIPYMKSSLADLQIIRLEIEDGEYVDESVIVLREGATVDYDGDLDAHKFFSFNAEYPQLYSTANDFMTINSLPLDYNESIPMDVRGANGNSMTITLTEANDFEKLYLKDEYTLDIVDLKKDTYSFIYDADITDRFTILFGITGIDNPTSNLNAKVFATGNDIQVNLDSFENANISVYNLLGQVVAGSFVNSNITRIPMSKSGYYLVKVSDGENVITQKVFIK